MAFVEIDTSKWPARGIQRGAATVSIRENGQIALSTATAEILKGCSHIFVRVDVGARIVQLQGVSEIPKGKEKACLHLAWPKKGKGVSFSFLKGLQDNFKDYNIAANGNQVLAPEAVKMQAEKKLIQFSVPVGTLPKREVKPRKPRTPKVAVAAAPVSKDMVDDDLSV